MMVLEKYDFHYFADSVYDFDYYDTQFTVSPICRAFHIQAMSPDSCTLAVTGI
jgi:hypothetical protein